MIEAGVDTAAIARRLYEEQPLERLLLIGRALEHARPLAGGGLLASVLTRADFDAAGGNDTEGIVEIMRGVRGMKAAALVSEAGPDGAWRVSLRSVDPDVDVSAIARDEGGGGHRAAAGFSTRRPPDDLLAWLDARITERLDHLAANPNGAAAEPPAGPLAGGQAGPRHVLRAGRGVRRRLGAEGEGPRTGTFDPFATGLLVLMVARATRLARCARTRQDVPGDAGTGSPRRAETGGPDRRRRKTRRGRTIAPRCRVRRRPAAAGPAAVGGEGRWASGSTRGPAGGEETELPEARSRCATWAWWRTSATARRCWRSLQRRHYVRRLASDIGERLGWRLPHRAAADGRGACRWTTPRRRTTSPARAGSPAGGAPHLPRREPDADGALEVAHGRWRGDAGGAAGRSRWCATDGGRGRAPRRRRAGCAPAWCWRTRGERFASFGTSRWRGQRRVVAIGTFDGVHVGHQAIMAGRSNRPRAGASTRWP